MVAVPVALTVVLPVLLTVRVPVLLAVLLEEVVTVFDEDGVTLLLDVLEGVIDIVAVCVEVMLRVGLTVDVLLGVPV